jgi:hypothetical protein
MHVLSLHNKHIRANAVNLTTLWAIMISDVLTHLGSHHETWNWMMYTVQVEWIVIANAKKVVLTQCCLRRSWEEQDTCAPRPTTTAAERR